MKVLIFMSQFYKLGGSERLAVELATALNKRGIHADILSMYSASLPGASEARQELLAQGIPNVRFLGMRVHPSSLSLVRSVWELRRLVRRHRYDIIETSMVTPSIIAAWACRGLAARQIAGIHDVFTKDRQNAPTHKFWRYSVRSNPNTLFYAISDHVATHWVDYSGTSADRTRTIPNSIANECFEVAPSREHLRAELGISSRARIALFVGRLLKRKGVDTLYEGLAPVLEAENITLLYVGEKHTPEHFFPDDRDLLEQLHARIERDGLGTRVRFLGRRRDVPRLMAGSDVLVHPARIEGFGLVLAEALAAGLPVVASDVDGIPEVLEGTGALMVPAGDPSKLREAVMESLARAPEQRAEAVRRGRTRAEDFREARRVNDLIRLFSEAHSPEAPKLVHLPR